MTKEKGPYSRIQDYLLKKKRIAVSLAAVGGGFLGGLAGISFNNNDNHYARSEKERYERNLLTVKQNLSQDSKIATVMLSSLSAQQRLDLGVSLPDHQAEPLGGKVDSATIDGLVRLPTARSLRTAIHEQAREANDTSYFMIGEVVFILGGLAGLAAAGGINRLPIRRQQPESSEPVA